jgi:hypothetical protein
MMDVIGSHDMCHHEMEDERLREHLIGIEHEDGVEEEKERTPAAPSADD